MAKPTDVPTYVEYGAADSGIVGKDTLLEEGRHLYEVLDLGFAVCRMVVAGPAELEGKLDSLNNKRVGTKYPRIAREYFEYNRRESIEIIKLSGSVELAPLVGLSEVIVDLVKSGRTLHENGLVILDEIADISSHPARQCKYKYGRSNTLATYIFTNTGMKVITMPSIPGVNPYTLEIPATSLSASQYNDIGNQPLFYTNP